MRKSRDQFGRFLPRNYNLDKLFEEQQKEIEEQVEHFEKNNKMGERVQVEDPPPHRTFSYPINLNLGYSEPPMKNISPSVLPSFRGKIFEDPEQFLFQFKFLCQTYDCTSDN